MSDQVRLTAAPCTSLASTTAPVQGADQTQTTNVAAAKPSARMMAEGCKTTVSQLQSQLRLLLYKPCSQCRRCSCTRNTQNLTTTERSCESPPEAGHAPAAPRLPGLRAAGSSPVMLSQTTGAESDWPAANRCHRTRHASSCCVRVRRRPSNHGLSRVFRKPRKRIGKARRAPKGHAGSPQVHAVFAGRG